MQGVSLIGLVGQGQVGELSKQQFYRFVKDIGLVETSSKRAAGAKLMNPGEVDLLFQRANMTNLQSRHSATDPQLPSVDKIIRDMILRASVRPGDAATAEEGAAEGGEGAAVNAAAAEEAAGEEAAEAEEEAALDVTLEESDADDDDDGGVASMVLHEFVAAIIRLAWTIYALPGVGIGERLKMLFSKVIVPNCSEMIHVADDFSEFWYSSRVQASHVASPRSPVANRIARVVWPAERWRRVQSCVPPLPCIATLPTGSLP